MSQTDKKERAEAIAKLNDAARRSLILLNGLVFTRGISELPRSERTEIIQIIQNYENWTQGNNPYGERDFGVIRKVKGRWTQEPQPKDFVGPTVFFKIDYYSKSDPNYGSECPEDASQTNRVMTVMLAEEY